MSTQEESLVLNLRSRAPLRILGHMHSDSEGHVHSHLSTETGGLQKGWSVRRDVEVESLTGRRRKEKEPSALAYDHALVISPPPHALVISPPPTHW